MPGTIILHLSVMLLLTIVLIVCVAFAMKYLKRVMPKLPQDIEVIGATSLGGKSKVILIQALSKKILIGVGENTIQTLHVYDKEQAFNSTLQQAVKAHED